MAPGTPSGCFIVGHNMMVAFLGESQFLLSRRRSRSMVSPGDRTMAKATLHIVTLAIVVTLSSGAGRYQLRMYKKDN